MTEQGTITNGTCVGELFIDSQSLHTPAWDCLNVYELQESGALRSQNPMIPGTRGVLPALRFRDKVTVTMRMIITGVWSPLGVHWTTSGYASAFEGLVANTQALRTLLGIDVDIVSLASEIHYPTLTTVVADGGAVQVENFRPVQAEGTPIARATFDLTVPYGAYF